MTNVLMSALSMLLSLVAIAILIKMRRDEMQFEQRMKELGKEINELVERIKNEL